MIRVTAKISRRKMSHLRICVAQDVQSSRSAGFDDVVLLHNALPEIDIKDIDLSTTFLSHSLSAPLMIEAMTGGTRKAKLINRRLAEAAEFYGIAMGVGSQRAAIENPELENTFRIVRDTAPKAFLIANIGAPQLSLGYNIEEARKAIEMISADALAIHLNPLQESIQPEGEPRGKGVLNRISNIVNSVEVPVIVKETGTGFSGNTAKLLQDVGVKAIDVAGRGGTDWGKVESKRPKTSRGTISKAEVFSDWGISTVASILEVTQFTKTQIIASGGVRDGIHVAKSIALGATMAGSALPFLSAAMAGERRIYQLIDRILEELKTAMFLTGSGTINSLRNVDLVISGEILNWAIQRGLDVKRYPRRLD